MAIRERLLKQLEIVRDGLNAMPPFHSRDLNAMRNALLQARDLCFQGLSENRFAEYKDTYDGLLLATEQLATDAPGKVEIISLCSELLQYMIAQTQKETSFKKEIFFLPYKASMWDSLESVWKAANEDKEHCIAYVMPIPYCDRNPDGSVAEWHCERDLFPKYVPTLDWQKVDLMAWHPDIIFYHYPYDDYNRVTSLDGRYYSRNLRQCADKLVYIPYFVLDEPCTEESVEHFVTTQGVLNADKVIVQSEAMRELYVNILMKRTNQPDRAYWEERISGAGSPKIEKVLTSKKEDFEMPEKWKRLVDGRKIILYNTSLTAMLQNSDKVCDKLRYVFDVFRNRDDVVLWWRPHPLMKSTFHSMRPQYENKYLSLEKQFIEEGWGIYDDTADLHRAICCSDAYYGDRSSVVNLYRLTEKPVMIEDLYNVGIEKGNLLIMGRCAVADGDDLWIFSVYANALLRFSLETECLLEYYPFPENPWKNASISFVKEDQCLYFAPCYARECWRFDIKSKNFDIIDIGLTDDEKQVQDKFRLTITCDGKVYMFGWNLPMIIVLDLFTGRYERIDGWASELAAAGVKADGSLINMFYTTGEHAIYVPIYNGPYILSLHTENDGYSLKRISRDEREYFCAIHYKAGKLYLTNNKDETVVLDLEDNNIQRIPNHFLSGQIVDYGYIFMEDGRTVYIPFTFSFIGYKTNEAEPFRKVTLPLNLLEKYPDGIWCKYSFVIRVGDVLYLQSVLDGMMYAIYFDDESVRVCNFSINEQLRSILQKRKKKFFLNRNQEAFEENAILSLDIFLEADVQKITGLLQDEKCFVGRKIYSECIL